MTESPDDVSAPRPQQSAIPLAGSARPQGAFEAAVLRETEEVVDEQENFDENAEVALYRKKTIVALRREDSAGDSFAADSHEDGSVSFRFRGESRQGEDGTYHTAELLVAHMNANGGRWSRLQSVAASSDEGKSKVDCLAVDGEATLRVQVVRVPRDPKYRERLARSGEASAHLSAEAAANCLLDAISFKGGKISQEYRSALCLALSALDAPALAFSPVVKAFHLMHAEAACAFGFDSIWLVGPRQDLVWRLDRRP